MDAALDEDLECGCPRHRARRIYTWWHRFVHHTVHPISALIVMGAAGVEVLEWLGRLAEHALHWLEIVGG